MLKPVIAAANLSRPVIRVAALVALTVAIGCGAPLFPDAPSPNETLDGPLEGLSGAQLVAHGRGDEEFARVFSSLDGLGPTFVAASCASCHVGDNRGHPAFNLVRFGRPGLGGFDAMIADGGPQLQHRAIGGYVAEEIPTGAVSARFMAPAVTGLGLLEAVDDSTILALADPADRNGDGISGRAAMIRLDEMPAGLLDRAAPTPGRHAPINGRYLARFGRKARTVDLLHQTVGAYAQDMGVTSDLEPHELYNPRAGGFATDLAPDPEASRAVVDAVVFYLRTLRPPPRRDEARADIVAGGKAFGDIGCASCHVQTLRTGRSDLAALDRVTFHPFTDLLLHDMGPELNDGYTEGDAAPAEWRTAPLWGIGLAERGQGGTPFFLHDGRARTLRDAIRLHGGEAARSRAAFDALPRDQQERLLSYLRSL